MKKPQDIRLDLEAAKLMPAYAEVLTFRDLKSNPDFARLVKAFAGDDIMKDLFGESK